VGWNFEPSELSAAFGLVQLEKLEHNLAARRRNFARLVELFSQRPDAFVLPRTTPDLETAWHMFPLLLRPESGVQRSVFQAHMEAHGVDTRMVWTGNVTRQPAFADTAYKVPKSGLPNADRVMAHGVVLPSNHALDDDDIDYIWATADAFFA
jgi:CDP-6-deoxy-D-xylo-4-hexulose-3-dehydrase